MSKKSLIIAATAAALFTSGVYAASNAGGDIIPARTGGLKAGSHKNLNKPVEHHNKMHKRSPTCRGVSYCTEKSTRK